MKHPGVVLEVVILDELVIIKWLTDVQYYCTILVYVFCN